MSLLIKGGEIVTASEQYIADIYCENETITRIDRNIADVQADEVIDATGKYVFPGFIDPHVHIYLPFMGTAAKDTHETASRAALIGGTTTFIEMICPARNEKPLEAFELWLGKAQGNSACDFTFHMGVTRYDDEAERDFQEIVRRGLSSFKVFLAYKGAFGVTDEELYKTLQLARSSASLRPRIVRTRISCSSCRGSCSRKARPARSITTGAGRRWWKPRACIT